MSTLGDVAAGAAVAVGGQLWKVAALVLLAVLLAGGAAGGALWWSVAAARDQALADLKKEQRINAQLRAGVDAQNTAILAQVDQAREAEARGRAAQEAAAANGRRYDQALQQIAGAKATSCADAMPYVNQLLEKVR